MPLPSVPALLFGALLPAFAACAPAAPTYTTVTSDDGQAVLSIPSTAGVDASTITLTAMPANTLGKRGRFGYVAKPDGLQFAPPATLTVTGPEAALGVRRADGKVHVSVGAMTARSGGTSELIDGQSVTISLENKTFRVVAPVSHFSDFEYGEDPEDEEDDGFGDEDEQELEFGPVGEAPAGPLGSPFAPVTYVAAHYPQSQVDHPIEIAPGTLASGPQGVSFALGTAPGGTLGASNPLVVLDGPTFTVPASMEGTHALTASMGVRYSAGTVTFGLEVEVAARTCESFAAGLGPSGGAAIVANFGPGFESLCRRQRVSSVGESNLHSTGTGKASDAPHTDTRARSITGFRLPRFQVGGVLAHSIYHCGDGPNALTVCPVPATVPDEGAFIAVSHVVNGPVPKSDPANRLVYGFVFDADGVKENNYRAPSNYPKDFYDDTDLWFEATYAPGTGWALTAKDAKNGSIRPVTTAARVIIRDDALVLLVPRSELAVEQPSWRVTAFRHKGDYGVNPPYDWSGDIEPPVGEALGDWP